MDIVEQAKGYLLRDCKYCQHYQRMDDGVELCRKRKWNSVSGHAAGSIKRKYGFAALPIYRSRICNQWEIKKF